MTPCFTEVIIFIRRQATGGRRQVAGDRWQVAGDRWQVAGGGRFFAEGW